MTTTASPITFDGSHGPLHAVVSEPVSAAGAVLLIHENRGMTPHFLDLTTRFAEAGYSTMCIDLASAEGGSEALGSEDEVRAMLSRTPREHLLVDVRSALGELARRAAGQPLGVVGFCFGGTMTWTLLDAGEPRLAAAVAFYGTTPDPSDFAGSSAAVLGIYAGLDERVNESRARAENALVAAGLTHRIETIEGADHAFFNDTRASYHEAAAGTAWSLTVDWLEAHLRSAST
jgi:carboxymethylenebutenolidase